MSKFALIKLVLIFLVVQTAYSQKVKYKDIFGLLSGKQYESAEPFLRKYLKENTDNPNAYLYMGIIQQEKSAKEDILKNTTKAIAHMDSAIFFFDKAYKSLTEKEVKRNDEYYQIYNRRDLRTGDFGVKLSDIQFDLEKRMEGLREKIDRVKMVKYYFTLADSFYRKSNALYTSIQRSYPSERELFLRSDEKTVAELTTLTNRYDSCIKAFENYKASTANLGAKTGYNQVLVKNEIKDFSKDGTSHANFYQDELEIWDYKKFAEQTRKTIEQEIGPMREHLVSYDVEINKLREKLSSDSVSVNSDLTKLIDKMLMDQLKKFDPDPLPMEVFSLKIADLEYRSVVLENKANTDSTNVLLKLDHVSKASKSLAKLDSIAGKLMSENIEKEAEDYNHFVTNTYGNVIVLKSYVKALKEYAERERKVVDMRIKSANSALLWIISSPDSIPLFTGNARSRFKPLLVVNDAYTSGLAYKDSLTVDGYFFTITPSRVPDIKTIFPVDKSAFKDARLSAAHSFVYGDPAGQVFYVLIYSDRAGKDGKYQATLAKIYRSDGLAWNYNYSLLFSPKEMIFKPETSEIIIRADVMQSVIDKNGKIR
jgi:hypothetical protein